MLTFFHAPNSRSTSILSLIKEMGIEDRITTQEVTIRRQDGSGARDPVNPHPDGKVPCLQDDNGDVIYERAAVMLYLTDRFPDSGLGPQVGEPKRGAYLSWLVHYQGVIEPLVMLRWAGVENATLTYMFGPFEDSVAHIDAALTNGPWLLGDAFSAADLLISGLFVFARIEPEQPRVRDWIKRCAERPAEKAAWAEDGAKTMSD